MFGKPIFEGPKFSRKFFWGVWTISQKHLPKDLVNAWSKASWDLADIENNNKNTAKFLIMPVLLVNLFYYFMVLARDSNLGEGYPIWLALSTRLCILARGGGVGGKILHKTIKKFEITFSKKKRN